MTSSEILDASFLVGPLDLRGIENNYESEKEKKGQLFLALRGLERKGTKNELEVGFARLAEVDRRERKLSLQ